MINTFPVLKMGEGAGRTTQEAGPSLSLPPPAGSLLNSPEVPNLGLEQLVLRTLLSHAPPRSEGKVAQVGRAEGMGEGTLFSLGKECSL